MSLNEVDNSAFKHLTAELISAVTIQRLFHFNEKNVWGYGICYMIAGKADRSKSVSI